MKVQLHQAWALNAPLPQVHLTPAWLPTWYAQTFGDRYWTANRLCKSVIWSVPQAKRCGKLTQHESLQRQQKSKGKPHHSYRKRCVHHVGQHWSN